MTATKSKEFIFKFEEVSVADAGILAEDLREAVLDAHPDVAAERQHPDGHQKRGHDVVLSGFS